MKIMRKAPPPLRALLPASSRPAPSCSTCSRRKAPGGGSRIAIIMTVAALPGTPAASKARSAAHPRHDSRSPDRASDSFLNTGIANYF